MKKYFPGVVIAAMLLAAILWWFNVGYFNSTGTSELPLTNQNQIDSSGDAENAPDLAAVESDDVKTGKGHAKRIVHVPDNNPDQLQSEHEIDIDFRQSVELMVESSLNGKEEDAITLSQLMNQCMGVADKEKLIQKRLRNMEQSFSPQSNFILGFGAPSRFESFEEYEFFLWERFDQCRATQGIFEDELRKRIALLADNGNAIARYLFAMWPPTRREEGVNNMVEWLEYQNQALEYTWQNIEEGEPLGLLAFGQSFRNFQPKFFTPVMHEYAPSLLMASKKCGITSPWLEAEINHFIGGYGKYRKKNSIRRIEDYSDEIKKLFCR
jgi:hypothetical protein